MIAVNQTERHAEVWLLLPWLANGRLAGLDRERVEEHVRRCSDCKRELEAQRLMCDALTEPDRVTYAPGPSFRKLMERIDNSPAPERLAPQVQPTPRRRAGDSLAARLGHVSLWRPPGLAWAASFLFLFGVTGAMVTAYHWSAPVYQTHTDAPTGAPNVLHIALNRTVPVGEVAELLRTAKAKIVEGPGDTGILGVVPADTAAGQTSSSSAGKQLRALSARLRTDPRVLWVVPVEEAGVELGLSTYAAAQ